MCGFLAIPHFVNRLSDHQCRGHHSVHYASESIRFCRLQKVRSQSHTYAIHILVSFVKFHGHEMKISWIVTMSLSKCFSSSGMKCLRIVARSSWPLSPGAPVSSVWMSWMWENFWRAGRQSIVQKWCKKKKSEGPEWRLCKYWWGSFKRSLFSCRVWTYLNYTAVFCRYLECTLRKKDCCFEGQEWNSTFTVTRIEFWTSATLWELNGPPLLMRWDCSAICFFRCLLELKNTCSIFSRETLFI